MATTLAGLIGAWFIFVLTASALGVFISGPAQPPLPMLVAIVGPPAVFVLAYRLSRRFRESVLDFDLHLLTAVQTWRVLGGVFLALYAFGLLPGLFAWPAGLGDVGVGVAAVFVLYAMIVGRPNWRRQVWWLNVAGLLDFGGAIGTGVLTSNSAFGLFAPDVPMAEIGALPLSLIPTFAVPLWIIVHMISLLQLRHGAAAMTVAPKAEAA